MSSPGVVAMNKFVSPSSKKYSKYLDYIDRDEAIRTAKYEQYNFAFDSLLDEKINEFEKYNDYMSNPEKTSALFSDIHDNLNIGQQKALKSLFQMAEENKSPMWQQVISFDNTWLQKFGRYDPLTHELDEAAVMRATRAAVREFINFNQMGGAVWSAAIHYNTDNIHVHIAIVEPHPSREKAYYKRYYDREKKKWLSKSVSEEVGKANGLDWEYKGYVPKKSFEKIKSQVVSAIADQSEMLKLIDQLGREQIGKKENFYDSVKQDKILQKMYDQILDQLPKNRSLWKYNNNAMKEIRPLIDEFSSYYIDYYHREDFKQLNEQLDQAVDFYHKTYGESRYDDYKENKLYGRDGLFANLGNTLLKDMNDYVKSGTNKIQKSFIAQDKSYHPKAHINFGGLNSVFKKSWQQILAERDYEKLQWEIEHSK